MKDCRAPACSRSAHGHSAFCATHMQRVRRHGHVSQRGVSAAELAPYAKELASFLDRRPDAHGWTPIETVLAAWKAALEGERMEMGRKAHNRFWRQALDAILAVTRDPSVTDRELIGTVGGMLLMQRRHPSRFINDKAFLAQVCRRFRGLNQAAIVVVPRSRLGASRRYTRDLSLWTTLHLGQIVRTGLGSVLLYAIEQMERQEGERARVLRDAYTKMSPGAVAATQAVPA
jgi:hypothetical protein